MSVQRLKEIATKTAEKAKYISPFYWGRRGLDTLLMRVFGTSLDRVVQNSALIYVVYRGGLGLLSQVRRDGLSALTSTESIGIVVSITVVGLLTWRYNKEKRKRSTAKSYNQMVEGLTDRGDPLAVQSTPIHSRPVPSRKSLIGNIIRTEGRRIKSSIPVSVFTGLATASVLVSVGRRWIRDRAVDMALRADIALTRVEAWWADEPLDPSTVPKPLREEWGMDEPDEVEYPLLDRDVGDQSRPSNSCRPTVENGHKH